MRPYDDHDTLTQIWYQFPYSIFYAELSDVTWVVAVAHAKRRPDYWRRRRIG